MEKEKFIKLKKAGSDMPIIIAIDSIVTIEIGKNGNTTVLTEFDDYEVTESLDTIWAML